MASVDLLDAHNNDWLGSEKAKAASDIVDSGVEYLINAGVTEKQLAAINLGSLDIDSATKCVLGQLFEEYAIGLDALDLGPFDQAVNDLGFCPGGRKGLYIDNALLTQAWRNKLTEMRN